MKKEVNIPFWFGCIAGLTSGAIALGIVRLLDISLRSSTYPVLFLSISAVLTGIFLFVFQTLRKRKIHREQENDGGGKPPLAKVVEILCNK